MSRKLSSTEELTASSMPKRIDALIIAAGADYRAYQALRLFNEEGLTIEKLIIVDFRQRRVEDDAYNSKYYQYRQALYNELIELEADIDDPSGCVAEIVNSGLVESSRQNLYIDISCFSKPTFYTLLKYFSISGVDEISVLYTQPRSYKFPQGNYRSYRSSSGPTSVREIPSFPGEDKREDEKLLVLLIGFDGDLADEIGEIVAPTKTVVINGFPSFEPKYKDISLICNEKLIRPSNKLLYSRSSSPFDVYNLLAKLVDNEVAVHIAPLGNKPMALGACLFAIHYPSVRVVYPFPEEYVNETTDECSHSWVYRMPLAK
ncbi:MAG: hypothetical protein NXH95_14310 [Pseudomonadaceae bacterium]|nr:hypothetical protein [Pseudomonadaceae bacterium]